MIAEIPAVSSNAEIPSSCLDFFHGTKHYLLALMNTSSLVGFVEVRVKVEQAELELGRSYSMRPHKAS